MNPAVHGCCGPHHRSSTVDKHPTARSETTAKIVGFMSFPCIASEAASHNLS